MPTPQDFLGTERQVPLTGETGWGPETTTNLLDILRALDDIFVESPSNLRLRERVAAATPVNSDVVTPTAPVMALSGSGGAVTITLAAGADGQILHLLGLSNTNTVSLAPSGTLLLNGPLVLAQGTHASLRYHTTLTAWVEVSRNN